MSNTIELLEYSKNKPCLYRWKNIKVRTDDVDYASVVTRVFYVNECIFRKHDAYEMFNDFRLQESLAYFVVINECIITRVNVYHLKTYEKQRQHVHIRIYINNKYKYDYYDVNCKYDEYVISLTTPIIFTEDDQSTVYVYVYTSNDVLLTRNNSLLRRKINDHKLLYELYVISIDQNCYY